MNKVKKLSDKIGEDERISLDLLIKEIEHLLIVKCGFDNVYVNITARINKYDWETTDKTSGFKDKVKK